MPELERLALCEVVLREDDAPERDEDDAVELVPLNGVTAPPDAVLLSSGYCVSTTEDAVLASVGVREDDIKNHATEPTSVAPSTTPLEIITMSSTLPLFALATRRLKSFCICLKNLAKLLPSCKANL